MAGRSKVVEKLESIQLQHWMRAAKNDEPIFARDPDTQDAVLLRMPLAISDGGGLTFTLSNAGTATWILRYRHGGRPRELTIGNYPDIGLAEARKIAREKRAEIDRGGDPAADKRRATTEAYRDWTVRQLIADYREKTLAGLGQSTQRSYGRNLLRIEAKMGALSVSTITSLDVVTLIEKCKATWTESNMLLCTAKMLFRHAAGRKLIAVNPCVGISLPALLGKRPAIKRRLMLTDEELTSLLNAKMRRSNALAIRVLLGTAVRSDELISAKWEDVDLVTKVWSIPSSKMGPGIQIPLTEPVHAWFSELKKRSRVSAYVLPARSEGRKERNDGDAPINKGTIASSIDYWIDYHQPAIRRFTPHDLRSTAKSHMRALGVARDITEMCLNHKLPGVEGIYDVHTYFEERKAALTLWSNRLVELENAGIENPPK